MDRHDFHHQKINETIILKYYLMPKVFKYYCFIHSFYALLKKIIGFQSHI